MTARSRSTSWRDWRTISSTRCSTSASTTSTIWLIAHSTRSESTGRCRTRRGRSFPLFPTATLVLASSRPSSTSSSSSTGLPSSTSSSRSSTGLDSSSRRGRARGYQHLQLVQLHQLHQHLRLHGWQLLLPIRRHPHVCATTVAIRGTTPALAPTPALGLGELSQDSRDAQLSPGRQHRVG